MSKRKPIRERGKLQLSKYFQEFEKGDSVAIVSEISMQPKFPKRLQGETGIIEEKRGNSYLVKIKYPTKSKSFLIAPIHLKKIKTLKKNDNQ